MTSREQRRGPGELESEVLAALWAVDVPLTPTQVLRETGGDLAYKTVHTILTRLQGKGLIRRVRHAGRSAYAPVKDSAQDAADRMRLALDSGKDRRAVLQRFVSALTPAEERALRALLAEEEAE